MNTKIQIKQLTNQEAINLAEEICKIQRAAWISTYPNNEAGITKKDIENKFVDLNVQIANKKKYFLDDSEKFQFGAFEGEKLVGYCLCKLEEGIWKLNSIYLLEEYQGQGIGGSLVKKALALIGDKLVEFQCAKYNTSAIEFYKRHGFEVVDDKAGELKLPGGAVIPLVKMRKIP